MSPRLWRRPAVLQVTGRGHQKQACPCLDRDPGLGPAGDHGKAVFIFPQSWSAASNPADCRILQQLSWQSPWRSPSYGMTNRSQATGNGLCIKPLSHPGSMADVPNQNSSTFDEVGQSLRRFLRVAVLFRTPGCKL